MLGGFFWLLLPTPETGGILKEKRQLWHFKGLPFFFVYSLTACGQ